MAFTSRAKRQTGLTQNSTPNNVGPSSYYPEVAGNGDQIRGRAPFSSTAERQMTSGQPQWVTPGPGSYIEQSRETRKAAASSNVFVNKVKRFSKQDMMADTPGPGTYTAPEKWIKEGSGAKPGGPDSQNSNVVWFRNPSAPSIPTHGQSFGYEQGNDGRLIRQLAPPGGYTGSASDSVGPGDYNSAQTALSDKGTTWSNSRTRRDFVQESKTPGPGHYSKPITGESTDNDIEGVKEVGTSNFASKVSRGLGQTKKGAIKNATPGPGAYATKSSFQAQEVPENLQFFGSTSRRSFEVEPSQYGADFAWKTPGPGSYEERRSGFQKGQGRRGKLAEKAAPPAPFDSLQPRFRGSGTDGPGPGQYDEDGKSLVTSLARKTRARNGVFGTTANRFFGSQLYQTDKKGGKEPGPGHYDVAANGQTGAGSKATGRRRRPKQTSNFKSGTQRFNSSAPSALPAPGDYDVVPKWPGQEPARLTLLERDVFIASAERFPAREIVPGATNNMTPGPGAYEAKPVYSIDPRHMGIAALEGRSTIGTAKRFVAGSGQRETLLVPGPGSYNAGDPSHSMVKRSYNITVDV